MKEVKQDSHGRVKADLHRDVVEQKKRVGITFWLAVVADEARGIVREHVAALGKGTNPMEKHLSKRRQFIIGTAVGLLLMVGGVVFGWARPGLVPLLMGIVLFLAIGITVGALAVVGAARLVAHGPVVLPRLEALTRYRGFAGGAATAGLLLLLGLAALNLFTAAPAHCSGVPSTSSDRTVNLPASLITSQHYLAQGDRDFDQGNCNQALANYSRAVALDPTNAQAFNNRAYTFMAIHNYAAALPDLDRAIALRPDYVNALMNRGDIYNYYYDIDYDRAVADYNRVLALGPAVYQQTSLCGHRRLALHHGWNTGVFSEVLTRGVEAGCPPNASQ